MDACFSWVASVDTQNALYGVLLNKLFSDNADGSVKLSLGCCASNNSNY